MDFFLILASQSPRRSALLKQAGYSFEVIPSRADELEAQFEDVAEIVVENALLKGREVVERLSSRKGQSQVVIAADTLVAMEQKVYGKPQDLIQAKQFLAELGGKAHKVMTGVFLHHLATGEQRSFVEHSEVVLKSMSEKEMELLFQKSNPLDKAAGYGFQDSPDIVTRLSGSQTNVIGLPMERLALELAHLTQASNITRGGR